MAWSSRRSPALSCDRTISASSPPKTSSIRAPSSVTSTTAGGDWVCPATVRPAARRTVSRRRHRIGRILEQGGQDSVTHGGVSRGTWCPLVACYLPVHGHARQSDDCVARGVGDSLVF